MVYPEIMLNSRSSWHIEHPFKFSVIIIDINKEKVTTENKVFINLENFNIVNRPRL